MPHATPFAAHFDLRLPLVQAPMVGVTTPELVAEASNAGALGSLAGAAFDAARLAAEVSAVRAATARPFAVNLFVLPETVPDDAVLHRALAALAPLRAQFGLPPATPLERYAPDFRAQLDTLIALRVPAASFTFGVLDPHDVARLKAAGTYVIGTATHLAEALAWRAAGADAVVAQGAEAGGHRGTFIGRAEDALIGTFALVPQLANGCGLPVLAAGGIMDGRGVAAALALGAQAAQLGTAFLTCAQSAAAPCWQARVLNSEATDSSVTQVLTGRHARGLRNTLMAHLSSDPDAVAPYPVQNALTQGVRQAAARAGDPEYMSLWAGQGAPLLRHQREGATVAELIAAIGAQWRAASADLHASCV